MSYKEDLFKEVSKILNELDDTIDSARIYDSDRELEIRYHILQIRKLSAEIEHS